jgi:NAD-dependent DNA ligase
MEKLRNTAQRIVDDAYEAGNPIMSDAVYDATFGDASTHHKLDIKTGQTTPLPLWMGSLDKKRDEKALNAWLDKTCINTFVISAKLDGISALYDPEHNKLYTRGNGQTGCDISRFIKHLDLKRAKASAKKTLDLMMDTVPERLWKDVSLTTYVRGELIMPTEVFDRNYKKSFKNPRNLVSGQFGKKTINKDIMTDIFFVPYEVIISGMSSQCPASEQLQSSYMLPWIEMRRSEISVQSLTKLLDEWTKDCVFAMDGLVVTEDRIYTRNTSGNPKYSIAFKKEAGTETAITTVTEVTWDISRWGLLKPVVHIEPVQLSGITIQKCSGHNAKYISDNRIGPGAQIVCVRSGDVIPYIVSVVRSCDSVTLPSSTWSGMDLKAEGDGSDDTIQIKTLTNIFSKLEVKHINTKTIEKMYNECGLNTFPKMLNCTKEELQPVFKDKSANRIVIGMTDLKSRFVKVFMVVGASGVLGFGLGAKRVENLFACLPTLRSGDWETVPTVEDVCRVEGFAKKMAERVVQCFPMMTSFIRLCVDNGIQLESIEDPTVITAEDHEKRELPPQSEEQRKPERKMKICLSGFRKKEIEKKYTVLSSVTKECEVLVCKSFEKETGKMTKAKKLGVKMVLLSEFE